MFLVANTKCKAAQERKMRVPVRYLLVTFHLSLFFRRPRAKWRSGWAGPALMQPARPQSSTLRQLLSGFDYTSRCLLVAEKPANILSPQGAVDLAPEGR